MPITGRYPSSMAESMTCLAPRTLVWMASNGLYSHAGICFRAAAWNTTSTPCMARTSRSRSRTSPRKNRSAGWSPKRARISDCFSSSRLRMQSRFGRYRPSISSTSLFRTGRVPPVTRTDASGQLGAPPRAPASDAAKGLGLAELQAVQARVGLAGGQELGVAADGLHSSSSEDDDLVGVEHGGEA